MFVQVFYPLTGAVTLFPRNSLFFSGLWISVLVSNSCRLPHRPLILLDLKGLRYTIVRWESQRAHTSNRIKSTQSIVTDFTFVTLVNSSLCSSPYLSNLQGLLCLSQNLHIWLGGMFVPEAYITATRQFVAQANNWSLEELALEVRQECPLEQILDL